MRHWLIYAALLALTACGGKSDKKFNTTSYQQQKETLLDKEKHSPLQFLEVVESRDKRNWFGQTVVKGDVRNTASLCSYKDIRLKLRYFNKQQQLVANHEVVYNETVKPGSSISFKEKFTTPKGTDSVAVSLMSAVAVGK
ncbi:hypothetical protein [Deminuibacter soli]|uniref:Lipoprotein n=1 Tax=Deminuibacter soli TaxID=2291815 RepID=A0A3E1NP21_9BACT|nr:hypothetical protein [Deminuibacter soli]RFM29647.1 hypothetical protein DXN05_01290 [Deminuibacter soli]